MRGWLLRGAGLLEDAMALHGPAVDVSPGPTFQEAHYAALLDLAECHLGSGDLDQAAATIDKANDIVDWTGSMSWRHRNRYRLLEARVASLGGNHAEGAEGARAVAAAAAERGDGRYERRALLTVATIDARAGNPADPEALAALIDHFVPVSGIDGWRDLSELAKATGDDKIWRRAEEQAARIVAEASRRDGIDGERSAGSVRRQLDRFRP
jgi:ATP/maltotriose-dependent transcriptional regulator MalT